MALPDTNQTNDLFYWVFRGAPTAPGTEGFISPYPCRLKSIQGIEPNASGGGTDFVMILRVVGGATVATITFPSAGSAEGVLATVTGLDTTTVFEMGTALELAYSSGAWITTTSVTILVEFQAA